MILIAILHLLGLSNENILLLYICSTTYRLVVRLGYCTVILLDVTLSLLLQLLHPLIFGNLWSLWVQSKSESFSIASLSNSIQALYKIAKSTTTRLRSLRVSPGNENSFINRVTASVCQAWPFLPLPNRLPCPLVGSGAEAQLKKCDQGGRRSTKSDNATICVDYQSRQKLLLLSGKQRLPKKDCVN